MADDASTASGFNFLPSNTGLFANGTSTPSQTGNPFDVNNFVNDASGVVKTLGTAYFAEETAKNALKAPAANTALVVGGVVVVAVLIYLVLKH